LAINNITDEQLERLSQIIKLDQELILYYVGVHAGLDGTNFLMLKYEYKSGTGNPPKESFKVLFDERNKIAAIQPFKALK
jgi:hypothetical protein